MKLEEMRKLSTTELEKKVLETKEELFDLRMKQATGTLRETHKITNLRKQVARLKTILKEKENGGK